VGKTTTPEFGTKCLTDSPLFGRTRNAWSGRARAGSSGGGGCGCQRHRALAIATDGGGSTRFRRPATASSG
jgi:aspartyl-tRNA(Asn)/glutamyl-tRNA(Gln) amidotransferase subunit A